MLTNCRNFFSLNFPLDFHRKNRRLELSLVQFRSVNACHVMWLLSRKLLITCTFFRDSCTFFSNFLFFLQASISRLPSSLPPPLSIIPHIQPFIILHFAVLHHHKVQVQVHQSIDSTKWCPRKCKWIESIPYWHSQCTTTTKIEQLACIEQLLTWTYGW